MSGARAFERFLPELESIRGLAAIAVAITHALIAFKYGQVDSVWLASPWAGQANEVIWVSWLLVLFNGAAAVTVFFVLSGIVLGMSLDKRRGNMRWIWSEFLITRIARIYPSVLAVSIFIAIYLLFFHQYRIFDTSSVWFNWWYQRALSPDVVLRNMLLLDQTLNPVSWTLSVEILAALVFPIMFKLSRSLGIASNMIVLVVLVMLAFYIPGNMLCAHLYKFYIGLLIPIYGSRPILLRLYRMPPLTSALLLLLLARTVWGFDHPVSMLAETMAAAMLMAPLCVGIAIHPLLIRLLKAGWVRWMGRISYSFYLWHFIVLYILATLLFENAPAGFIQAHTLWCGIGLAISSVVIAALWADWMYRHVERWGMRIGKQFVAFMGKGNGKESI